MKAWAVTLAMAMVLATVGSAEAARADRRQGKQAARTAEGVRSGELTRHETRKIARQQRHIQRTKRRARADGKVTRAERAKIERKQDRASRNIARKKHNGRSR